MIVLARRQFLRHTALGSMALMVGAAEAEECSAPTVPESEGPFYKAGAPERSILVEPGMSGTRLTLSGRVLNANCAPLSNAVIDLWQADSEGVYDNKGFRLRARLHTDKAGRYRLETILPKGYPAGTTGYRCAHLHVKVGAPGSQLLTTELYFPGDAHNSTDSMFRASRLIDIKDATHGQVGNYDFVVA